MKIAVVVHGRFHAFHLARALIQRERDVTVFTNYPKWAAGRFGLPTSRVRSFLAHGVLARGGVLLDPRSAWERAEAFLHSLFGRWAARQLRGQRWDVIYVWSGVAEEVLRDQRVTSALRLVVRGSAHIRAQAQLLAEEENRTGVRQDRPSAWRVAREEREYALADRVVVLSEFARRTFIAEGIEPGRIIVLPLGARASQFRPAPHVVEARHRRLLDGGPIRVLYVGNVSFQKGFWDLAETIRQLAREEFQFRVVGAQPPETRAVLKALGDRIVITPRVDEAALPDVYEWGDVFVFPTIQDGYAAVLAQAAASGLPILTTTNCQGPDFIRDGENGWIVPVRSPDALVERLRWCSDHRREVAAMATRVHEQFRPRDWADVAADFEAACQKAIEDIRMKQVDAGIR